MTVHSALLRSVSIACLALLTAGCGTRVSRTDAETGLASPVKSSAGAAPSAGGTDLAGGAGSTPDPADRSAAAPENNAPASASGASAGSTGSPAAASSGASSRGAGTSGGAGTGKATGNGSGSAPGSSSAGSKPSAGSGSGSATGGKGAPSAPPSPGVPNPAPSPGATAAKSPIIIGSIGTYSGPLGSVLIQMVHAVQVWARLTNDRGGLNGHPVKLLIADDGGDPARHRAQVQDFVERQKVIAFVANGEAVSGQGSISYLQEKRVPVIGSEGANDYFYENTMYFPQAATGTPLYKMTLASAAQQLLPARPKLATLVCREATACTTADKVWGDGYAKSHGFDLVYRGQASVAQPDFTAECLNAQRTGAQVFLILMDTNSVLRIANSCSRQGYKPTFAWAANSTGPTQPQNPALEGGSIGATAFPWMVGDTPATAEFQAAMAQYQKGVSPTGSHTVGWVAAKVFEKAAAAMPEPPTSAAVLEGLWKINHDDLGGLTYPLTFNRDKPTQPRVCWFNVRISGGTFTAPAGARYSCE